MKSRGIKRILAAAMIMAITSMGALADQVCVTGTATVYSAPDTGKAALTLPSGTMLELVAQKNGWAQVTKGGKTGYMRVSDLVEVEALNLTAYARTATAIYAGVSGGSKVSEIPAGAAVTVTLRAGDIACVKYGDVKGYVKVGNLTTQAPAAQSAEQPAAAQEESVSITAYVSRDGAKVYDGAGKARGTLKVNTQLTIMAVRGDVCRVTNGQLTAYMKKSDLSTSPVEVFQCRTAYVARDGAKVYNAAGQVVGTLKVNTELTVTAVNGAVCAVASGGKKAYMYAADLSCDRVTVDLKYGDSGESVKKLQSRLMELGWFSGTVGGNYQDLTRSAVTAFQSEAKLSATGVADAATLQLLYSDAAPKKPAAAASSGVSAAVPAKGTAIEMDWWTSDIQSIFARGTVATVTDVATGLAWQEKRTGGTNHADCQPLTAADTAIMKKVYGSWSWDRRAVFVTINGVNYAASINGKPHGSGSIKDNNFDGHHCIHFTNSRTHGSNRVCPLHQAAIKKAASAVLG